MDKKYKIVVWLAEDYSKSEDFECPSTLTKEEITEEINSRFSEWYYYDIWYINGKKEMELCQG